ncbi:unnamed protein product [Polarella glacialis]|uniref:Uncharacterized protein n=1 Tax=Polarella glacialis TaxID=89957 RepID=A0A813DEM9_POLGL|nr:unnamed protein product [Polarella glacialis]
MRIEELTKAEEEVMTIRIEEAGLMKLRLLSTASSCAANSEASPVVPSLPVPVSLSAEVLKDSSTSPPLASAPSRKGSSSQAGPAPKQTEHLPVDPKRIVPAAQLESMFAPQAAVAATLPRPAWNESITPSAEMQEAAAETLPQLAFAQTANQTRSMSSEQESMLEELRDKLLGLSVTAKDDKLALPRFADQVHSKFLRKLGPPDKAPYLIFKVFEEMYCDAEATVSWRKILFFAFNEICRPLRKNPADVQAKFVRHAGWELLKAMTTARLSLDERKFLARFLRRQSASSDEASFIWRAAGTEQTETSKDWQQRLSKWEGAIMGNRMLVNKNV